MKSAVVLVTLLLSLSAFAEKRTITMVNYETEGIKQWVPGHIFARKGDEVEVTLINNVPSGNHGFYIPDYGITKVVMKGKQDIVKFKVDKEGIFEMKCHMHPAHVGGQLVVLP